MADKLELMREVVLVNVAVENSRVVNQGENLRLKLDGDNRIGVAGQMRKRCALLDKVVVRVALNLRKLGAADELHASTAGNVLHPRAAGGGVVVGGVAHLRKGTASARGSPQRHGIDAAGGAVLDSGARGCNGRGAAVAALRSSGVALLDLGGKRAHALCVLLGRLGFGAVLGGLVLVDKSLKLGKQIIHSHFVHCSKPFCSWRLPASPSRLQGHSYGAQAPCATAQSLR